MTTLVREYGREYSLLRTALLDQIVNVDMAARFPPLEITGSYAVYWGHGLVYGYHGASDFATIFRRIGVFAQDEAAADALIDETGALFQWLLPRYELRDTITSVAELREFYDRYRTFFLTQGIVQVLPRVDTTPARIKERAQAMRERIQEHNEHAELVFADALGRMYPDLGSDWRFLLPSEIWDETVRSPETRAAILERNKGYVLYRDQFYAGADVHGFLAKLGVVLEDIARDGVHAFRGQAAYLGQARGIVRIVDGFDAIGNVGDGDILVTTMTMPRYLPAMARAAAFVTDEGGVTCHAAIIAREMKKPCIIGTKVATRTLRDGDLVEVDADHGIVRILERV